MELVWMDARLHVPPDESLLLVIEEVDCLCADMVAGFYAEGQYHVGSSAAGNPLPDDQFVSYWAVAVWPVGYDAAGICQTYQRFTLDNGFNYLARQLVDGVLLDPKLPPGFDNTPNDQRSGHEKYWNMPFIVTESVSNLEAYYAERTDEYAEAGGKQWNVSGRASWMAAWPSGTRYEVRCLDGGAWDRSTSRGMFPTLKEAVACANAYRKQLSS